MTCRYVRFTDDLGRDLEIEVTFRIIGGDLEIEGQCGYLYSERNLTHPTFGINLTVEEDERLHAEMCADPATWEIPDDL